MRVLHVIRPASGGMRKHLADLIIALNELGVGSAVVAPPDFTWGDVNETPRVIQTVYAPITSRTNLIQDLSAAAIVDKTAKSLGIDVIHGHGLRGGWIAKMGASGSKKPYVLTLHNLAPQLDFIALIVIRKMLKGAAARIIVSRAIGFSFTRYGLSDIAFDLIPNGVDADAFQRPADFSRSRSDLWFPICLAIGRLSPEKGFDVLVRTAALMPDVRFELAGEGSEAGALRRLADELSLGNRWKMHGFVRDVRPLLWNCDVVAIPSRSEGQGITALEAMAAGLPVVASRVGGLPETVLDGVTGFLVEPDNPVALAEALQQVIADPLSSSVMGEMGQERVTKDYTLGVMAERTIGVYRRACERVA